jgi:hypothetical protein
MESKLSPRLRLAISFVSYLLSCLVLLLLWNGVGVPLGITLPINYLEALLISGAVQLLELGGAALAGTLVRR